MFHKIWFTLKVLKVQAINALFRASGHAMANFEIAKQTVIAREKSKEFRTEHRALLRAYRSIQHELGGFGGAVSDTDDRGNRVIKAHFDGAETTRVVRPRIRIMSVTAWRKMKAEDRV